MLTRRTTLSVLASACAWPEAARAALPDIMRLWPDTPPGGGGPSGPEHVSRGGAIRHIAVPHLRVYRPANPTGAAVLVAAGGGYRHIDMRQEAAPAARWLAAHGITAFALLYRLPGEGWTAGADAPLQDAQRAMRIIRADSAVRGKIGALGFSSGGHLMGMVATRFDEAIYAPLDKIDRLSARPDNAALIYPIITLEPPYDDTSTRRRLIGQSPTQTDAAAWSVQTNIRKGDPPFFLVQAADDPVSNPANTQIMQQACQAAGAPVERHLLPQGGHGFGMGKPGTDTALWPAWYQTWLQRQGMFRITG